MGGKGIKLDGVHCGVLPRALERQISDHISDTARRLGSTPYKNMKKTPKPFPTLLVVAAYSAIIAVRQDIVTFTLG